MGTWIQVLKVIGIVELDVVVTRRGSHLRGSAKSHLINLTHDSRNIDTSKHKVEAL